MRSTVSKAVQLCVLLLLATLKGGYTKLSDGSECVSDGQCDGGYCATKKTITIYVARFIEKTVCCSRRLGESCSAIKCPFEYNERWKSCDPCCGRLNCKQGFCKIDSTEQVTEWSYWTNTWSTGGLNTRLQVCVDERLQHRYRTVPDFYNLPIIEFKALTHTSSCEINAKCHDPLCTETVSVSAVTLNYMGCFISERHFFNVMVQMKPMDPQICFTFCSKYSNVRYYGVYHNSFCGCVDKVYSTKFAPVYRDERKCTEKCIGNSGLYCGGLDAANMYCFHT